MEAGVDIWKNFFILLALGFSGVLWYWKHLPEKYQHKEFKILDVTLIYAPVLRKK